MSADNFIAIQRRGRKWHVWMGFESSTEPHIPYGYDHGVFTHKECAELYAQALEGDCSVIEYGIWSLDTIGALIDIWQRVAAQKHWLEIGYIMVRNQYRKYRRETR